MAVINRRNALSCAAFTQLLPVIDPFRLSHCAIMDRVAGFQEKGFEQIILSSTDDALYTQVMPGLVRTICERVGIKVVEHFRPCLYNGFRAQPSTSWVLMSTVPTSREPHYRDCNMINGRPSFPLGRGLTSIAVPFGPDGKTAELVSALQTDESEVRNVLDDSLRCHTPEVVYLFCRRSRLRCETVTMARALIGPDVFLVASGNVRRPQDLHELVAAGADGVAACSIFEEPDWRGRLDDLLQG
jgi:hypothetical protein